MKIYQKSREGTENSAVCGAIGFGEYGGVVFGKDSAEASARAL